MSQIVIQKVGHFEINLWTALWSYGYNQTIFSFVLILTLEQCAFAKKKTWWLHSITLIGLSNCNIRAVLRMLLCVVEIRLTIQISVSVQGFLGISIIWSRYCELCMHWEFFFLVIKTSLLIWTLC